MAFHFSTAPIIKAIKSKAIDALGPCLLCIVLLPLSSCEFSQGIGSIAAVVQVASPIPQRFAFASGTATKIVSTAATTSFQGTCVGAQNVSIAGSDGSHTTVPCTNSVWSWQSSSTTTEGLIEYQFSQSQGSTATMLKANWYRRNSGVMQFFENDPSINSDDIVFLASSSSVYKIQDPFDTTATSTTTALSEASPVDNLLVTQDQKHLYYAMGGLLYCYSLSSADESADCLHRRADVTTLAALNGQNHGPLGPAQGSAFTGLAATDFFSWSDAKTLAVNRGNQLYQYSIPQPTSTTAAMAYGVNLHSNADYGNATLAAVDQQFAAMAAVGLTLARVGGAPTVGANGALNTSLVTETQNWLTSAKNHGIKLVFNLNVGWTTCPTDAKTFPSGSSIATLYTQSYNGTYNFISALTTYADFNPNIIQWELGNEIDLIGGEYTGAPTTGVPWLWNAGWTGASWEGQSVGGTQVSPNMTNYYEKWNATLAGAADAVAAINSQRGTHMPRIMNVVWTHMGFISFMQNPGPNGYGPVNFEKISYHYYQSLGTSAYSLAASAPSSGVNYWNMFQSLAAFNKPVLLDEFNCGEIYGGNVTGTTSNSVGSAYTACLTNLRTQIGYVKNNSQLNIEGIYAYELLDEPTNNSGAESEFGLYWNNNGVHTPKANLYLWSAFAGTALSDDARTLLTSMGLLPLP